MGEYFHLVKYQLDETCNSFYFRAKNRRQYFNHTCIEYRKIHTFSFNFFHLFFLFTQHQEDEKKISVRRSWRRPFKIIIKCSSKIVVGWILELEIQDLFRSGSSSSSSSHLESERMNFFFFPPMHVVREGFLEICEKKLTKR